MPFKKGNTLGKGRKRGAKSIVSEAWYQMALRYKDDPEGFGGYEGFRDYFNKSPRNKETYVRMMAGFAGIPKKMRARTGVAGREPE